MKIFVLVLLLVPVQLLSQSSKKVLFTSELNTTVYELPSQTQAPSSIQFPFGNIKVLDFRFDTTKIGFESAIRYHNVKFGDFKKVILKGGTQRTMESFYNSYYSPCFKDTGYKLLIILKTLWIDNFPEKIDTNDVNNTVAYESFQDIHLKFEYYFQKDNFFYPVKRIDTVLKLTSELLNLKELRLKKNDLSFFTYAIKSALETCDFWLLKSKIPVVKQLSLASIDSFNMARFRLPALNSATLKKGIYLDYKEFVNNSPSITDFEVKRIKEKYIYFNRQKDERVKKWYVIVDDSGLRSGATEHDRIIQVENTFEGYMLHYMPLPKTNAANLFNAATVGTEIANSSSQSQNLPYSPMYFTNKGKLYPVLVPRQFNLDNGKIY